MDQRRSYQVDVHRTEVSVEVAITRPYGADVDRDDLALIRDWLTSLLANPGEGEP